MSNQSTKQYCYQDKHGVIYPDFPSLRFKPDLVPGFLEKGIFTPVGNPQKQTGNIITEIGLDGQEKLQSGLAEDKGAGLAPLNGVAFGVQKDSDMSDESATESTVVKRIIKKK